MMQNGKLIDELTVYDGEQTTLFSDALVNYVIPLYQRAYAWTDTEIEQLIDDIQEHDGERYYIGSLIVCRRESGFEVIDGQQRLTTLLLLMIELELPVKNTLSFACRKRADNTLSKFIALGRYRDGKEPFDAELEQNLVRGRRIIAEKLRADKIDRKDLSGKLAHLKLYRIQVPPGTDLNRYFEIMNTRGEQLEQHDILKATLMSEIQEAGKRELFAKIWGACSDMTGYVQMHFDTAARSTLFGGAWNQLPEIDYDALSAQEAPECGFTLDEILAPGFKVGYKSGSTEQDEWVRFDSIIDFPYFLLHALRVYICAFNVWLPEEKQPRRQLDDKKLLHEFDLVMLHGKWGRRRIADYKEKFSLDFIECLLQCRFLFDQYIIKREFANGSADGAWSLKHLKERKRKAYYKNTEFKDYREWYSTYGPRNENILMLQSALRVSYTSPKVMHWITELLVWLYDDDNRQTWWKYGEVIEQIAIQAVKNNFLDIGDYHMGVNTPHIVFNYLDYLLWREDPKQYSDFSFEFRNSVEHWYPQHPSEGTFEPWKAEDVDAFGNLCIIQRSVNSKFSNMAPAAKKATFGQMIGKGSLKLRFMAQRTGDARGANDRWKLECQKHGAEMLQKLKAACGEE